MYIEATDKPSRDFVTALALMQYCSPVGNESSELGGVQLANRARRRVLPPGGSVKNCADRRAKFRGRKEGRKEGEERKNERKNERTKGRNKERKKEEGRRRKKTNEEGGRRK